MIRHPPTPEVNREGWWTREHALIVVLVVATALLLFLCWQLVQPFLTPIAWALALAVVAHPLHSWIARKIEQAGPRRRSRGVRHRADHRRPGGLCREQHRARGDDGREGVQAGMEDGKWREQLAQNPHIGGALATIEQQGNLGSQAQGMAGRSASAPLKRWPVQRGLLSSCC